MTPRTLGSLASLCLLLAPVAAGGVKLHAAKVISIGETDGEPFENGLYAFAATPDGRYLAFASPSDNVMPGVAGFGAAQIFWRDTKTGVTRLVSQDVAGNPADASCSSPTISADGSRVAFTSSASNFGLGGNGHLQVLFADLFQGTLRVASKSTFGAIGDGDSFSPALSADGKVLAFASDAPNLTPFIAEGPQIMLYDAATDDFAYASVSNAGFFANDDCSTPALSSDGRFCAYATAATNLPDAGAAATMKIVVWDRENETCELVSKSAAGVPADSFSFLPAITPDGRRVAFLSFATNLVPGSPNPAQRDLYVYDRAKDKIARVATQFSEDVSENPTSISISANANRIAISTSFLPGGAILPAACGHVYDRKQKLHLVVATVDPNLATMSDDCLALRLTGSGKRLLFISGSLEFDLLGENSDQLLSLSLAKW